MTAPRAADPVNTVTPPQAVFKDSMQSLDNKSQNGLSNLLRGKDILNAGLCPIIKIKTLPPWSTDNNYLWHLQIKNLHCFLGNSCEALTAPWFSIARSEDSQKVWVPEEDTNLGGIWRREAFCSDCSPDAEGQSSKARSSFTQVL